MTDRTAELVAVVALIVLALPTGLCSLYFGPLSIAMFFSGDPVSQAIAWLAAILSTVGLAIAGLTLYFASRVSRRIRSGTGNRSGEP